MRKADPDEGGTQVEHLVAPEARAATGTHCRAPAVGNLVYLSGRVPLDSESGRVGDDIRSQTPREIDDVEASLRLIGCMLCDVVRVDAHLVSMDPISACQDVYLSRSSMLLPARTVRSGLGDILVEPDCVPVGAS